MRELLVSGVLCAALWAAGGGEPTRDGRTLIQWLQQATINEFADMDKAAEAEEAIQAMGHAAAPALTATLQSGKTTRLRLAAGRNLVAIGGSGVANAVASALEGRT